MDGIAMASRHNKEDETDHVVPEDDSTSVRSSYLRSPSPSRFSVISDTDTESIFMEPMHLSALMGKQTVNEEMKPQEVKEEGVADGVLDSVEQMMVEDLYNCVKDIVDDSSPYNTPCVLDIQRALVKDRLEAPLNPVDEVWPNIFIAEKMVAVNKSRLKRMGITHVLNAAHGTGVYTGQEFYASMNIQYHGIEVDDFPSADISPYLRTAAEFLDEALLTHRGKVLVDSVMGVSRSAVLVAAYLMIFHHMTIMEALLTLRKKRAIYPNEGFLKQLRDLNEALLEERDEDDRSDTLSQCSVIDTRAQQEESIMGAEVHSILVEEEDGASVVSSSVASAAQSHAAADREGQTPTLPGEEEGDDDDVDRVIREWQQRNEKYQSEDWWQAQLMCEDGDESLLGGRRPLPDDLESVTSADVQAVKEQLQAGGRARRRPRAESVSTDDSSCADLWKQRLREIEEQAAARYRGRTQEEDSEAGDGDEDTESVLSESSSLYNFCKRNKDTLTPLERWRVKRIQFGWNKRDGEGEKGPGGEQGEGEGQENKPPSLEDVNLTAYQSWKLKKQKKLGSEDKDEIVELSRSQDSVLAKRRQRREEILERARKTLEESQSVCGWDTESSLSGSTIPLSAFWPLTGTRSTADDTASMLSMQSGRSSLSQARSAQGPALATPMVPALVPPPNLQGTGPEVVNLASIQNWIANVVTETLIQKQNEMMGGSLPPSRAGSVLSLGGRSAGGRSQDDDKASMLSGASYSSALSRGGSESVLSAGGMSGLSGLGSSRGKITKTSVPLYSLFQDQVNLRKLDSMDKEMKSEMRDKMATYELQKIASDNKRSTLFKKKKPKEEDDEDDEDEKVGTTKTVGKYPPAPVRDRLDTPSVRTGRYSTSAAERDKTSSIDKWLNDIKAPSRYARADGLGNAEPRTSRSSLPGDQVTESSDYTFCRRRDFSESSFDSEGEYDSENDSASRFSTRAVEDSSSSRYRGDITDTHNSMDLRSEQPYPPRRMPSTTEPLSNGLKESQSYRMRRSYTSEEEDDEEEEEYAAKRTFTRYSRNEDDGAEVRRRSQEDEEQEEEVSSFISRCRLRSRTAADEDLDEDDVISAWRRQQESKRHTYRGSDS